MNLKLLFILSIAIMSNSLFAQFDSLTVNSACGADSALGSYIYLDMYNGKPRFATDTIDYNDCSQFLTYNTCDGAGYFGSYQIRWNGSNWEWVKQAFNCVWLVELCVPNSMTIEDSVFATNSSNTFLPPEVNWTANPNYCIPEITTGDTCNLTDHSIMVDTSFCSNGSLIIDIGFSQKQVRYYLRDDSNNFIIDGAIDGTGSSIMLNTGSINSTTTFNVYTYSTIDSAMCNLEMTEKITVTINNPVSVIDTRTECDSLIWIDGNTYSSNNDTATYIFAGGAANGCDSIVTLNLTINNVSDLTTIINNNTITANNTNATYQWLDCDSSFAIITGETNQSFSPVSNGNYAVELTENGCVDTTSCVQIVSVGILKNDFGDAFHIYPNPSAGNFTINLGSMYNTVSLSITDLSGKLIQTKTFNKVQIIPLTINEASGNYILNIQSLNKKATIRLIKK